MKNHPAELFPFALAISVALAFGCGAKNAAPTSPSAATDAQTRAPTAPTNSTGASAETVKVLLCDGKTTTTVPKGTPATTIAGALMAEWIRKNPDANWEGAERERHTLMPAADNHDLVGQASGQTYGRITDEDVLLWKTETERVALAGSQVFHDGGELGSTIGVSCDMCHPHGANTHPETYPKFQPQLGRVVLLRDMINWCIEHPVRGTPFSSDDPRLRSLEAYILAQRKGKALEYGKR